TGTPLTFPMTGNSVASIETSFRTTLFGRRVGQAISVSKNGYLVFGPSVNGANTIDEALPSAKLEPLSVAPYWESLTITGGVFWQVKTVAGVDWLIVQWNTSTATFQARIATSGRVDFDYAVLPATVSGRAGVVGVRPNQFVAGAAVPDAGLTFFGPRAMPVTLRATLEGPIAGQLEITPGNFLPLLSQLDTVVTTNDLSVTEVMSRSSLAEGNWVELRNTRDVALDLAGWTFNAADGGTVAVTGTVPARGMLVVGSSTDPSLNDDAGVSVALTSFDGVRGLPSLVFGRGGAHNTLSLAAADAGRAVSFDPGRILPASVVTTCAAGATYGTQVPLQLGTPGRDVGCGFPYALSSIAPGYFDISGTGTGLLAATGNFDDSILAGDLSAHPVPVFGTTFSAMQVSTNGFITFDAAPASTTNWMSITTPSTTDSNTMLSVFGDDLHMNVGGGQIFLKFCAMGEDPFAAAPHWIVQWHHFGHYAFGGSLDDLNFQAKIFTDGVIEYHYADMQSRTVDVYGSGSSAVTWLENPTGTAALTVNVSSTNPGLSPNSAFRFTPR
ncbi:MAG: lamin tail domain-containing protein, partial [Archangium sp.]|nr:lamin tail domain-containing protein [Archangium sp.]